MNTLMLGCLNPTEISPNERREYAKLLMIETLMGRYEPLRFFGFWESNHSFKNSVIDFDQLLPWYKGDYEYVLYALIKDIFEYGSIELEKMIIRGEIDLSQAINIQERDFQNVIPQYLIAENEESITLYAFDRSI